jgi:type I restriction enzyme R subunit
MKFTEAQLEQAFIELLSQEEMLYTPGAILREEDEKIAADSLVFYHQRASEQVLIEDDLTNYLAQKYASEGITLLEINSIVRDLERLPASDLYESNKTILKMITDGFLLKRDDRSQKDIYIQLIDYSEKDQNTYRIVNQLAIKGSETRIPDLILYINGIPMVVFEFKTAIQENTSIHDAYIQLTTRYKRDIPDLFK